MRTDGYTAEPKPYQVSIILQPKRQKITVIFFCSSIFLFKDSSQAVNMSTIAYWVAKIEKNVYFERNQ